MDGIVTLEAAMALAELAGYNPDHLWCWVDVGTENGIGPRWSIEEQGYVATFHPNATHYPAVPETVALDWLYVERGYEWWSGIEGCRRAWGATKGGTNFDTLRSTPSELIIAICRRIKEVEDVTKT